MAFSFISRKTSKNLKIQYAMSLRTLEIEARMHRHIPNLYPPFTNYLYATQ